MEHTPGPWEWVGKFNPVLFSKASTWVCHSVVWCDDGHAEADAKLIAAAPQLKDGCNAMLGLVQLLLNRDDLTPALREVLTTNHRIDEAEAALKAAL